MHADPKALMTSFFFSSRLLWTVGVWEAGDQLKGMYNFFTGISIIYIQDNGEQIVFFLKTKSLIFS